MSPPRRKNGLSNGMNNDESEPDSSDSDSFSVAKRSRNSKASTSAPQKVRNSARKSTTPQKSVVSNKSKSLVDWTRRRLFATKSCAGRTRSCIPKIIGDEGPTTRKCGKKATKVSQPSTSFADSHSDDSDDDFDLNSSSLSMLRSRDSSRPLPCQNTPSSANECELESGSETPDSDEVPVKDKSPDRRKVKKISKPAPKARRGRPSKSLVTSTPRARKKSPAKKTPSHSPQKNKEAFESLVNKCVYFLLIADHKKYVIRKQAIIEHVFKDQSCSTSMFKDVIGAAGKILQKTFGFEMLSDKDQKDAYMIINILKPELNVKDLAEYSRLKTQQRGLILFLLTIIFMNENPIPEGELWKVLKPLGIDALSRKPHPVFGDVRKFIGTELVRQMYLESRTISKDPPQVEFSWGKRALQEVDKRDVLEFACQVIPNTKPEDWVLQYKEALEAAGENRDVETD